MQGTGTSSLRQPLQSSSGRLGRIASLRAQIATPALHPKEIQFSPEGRHMICPKFTSKFKYCFWRLSLLRIWARPLMIARNTEISFNTRDRRLFELTTAQPKETESRPSAPTPPILRRRTRFPSGACFGRALFGGRHTVNGTPRISSIQPHPSSDPKNRPKIEEPPAQYGGRRKGRDQQRKSSVSPYSWRAF